MQSAILIEIKKAIERDGCCFIGKDRIAELGNTETGRFHSQIAEFCEKNNLIVLGVPEKGGYEFVEQETNEYGF